MARAWNRWVVTAVVAAAGACTPQAEGGGGDAGAQVMAPRTSMPDPAGVEAGDPTVLSLVGSSEVHHDRFVTSTGCALCHSNHTAATAMRDEVNRAIAPFNLWQSSMMANAARDPLWRAVVSAETAQTPAASSAIEAKCMRCHAPMASEAARAEGWDATILDLKLDQFPLATLGVDGVACALCHQVQPGNLGTEESYSGGFTVGTERLIWGPHQNVATAPMRNHVNYTPTYSTHVTESSLCATCHNLTTHPLDPGGNAVQGGEFHEQSTYAEWRNSEYSTETAAGGGRSCQSCHMPTVSADGNPVTTRIARSPPGGDFNIPTRQPFGRHVFAGANVLMPGILKNERDILNPQAPDFAFDATVEAARQRLENGTATVAVSDVRVEAGRAHFNVTVSSEAGHKFPTGFPSRRAWLRVRVLDAQGAVLFASGSFTDEGRITDMTGAVLDTDKAGGPWEPHHAVITRSDEVQIYEQVMGAPDGTRTASVMRAALYLKDNRLLPRGYVAGHAEAARSDPAGVDGDADFAAGSDRVAYAVDVGGGTPASVEVTLVYQTLGSRFARDLFQVDTPEVRAFRTMLERADRAPVTVATASATF